jgi:CSLREA domain-containing protein
MARAAEYTVNSTGDQVDEALSSAGCKTALATCTLRAAMEESNASVGVEDTINSPNRLMPEECETDYYSFPAPCVGIEGPVGLEAWNNWFNSASPPRRH